MNRSLPLALTTLVALFSVAAPPAQAATTMPADSHQPPALQTPARTAPSRAAHATRAGARAAHTVRHAEPAAGRLDRMHLEVALSRSAEQHRRMVGALRSGRLDPEHVETMEREQARIDGAIARFAQAGPISVQQALDLQHQQDLQDWAIRGASPSLRS